MERSCILREETTWNSERLFGWIRALVSVSAAQTTVGIVITLEGSQLNSSLVWIHLMDRRIFQRPFLHRVLTENQNKVKQTMNLGKAKNVGVPSIPFTHQLSLGTQVFRNRWQQRLHSPGGSMAGTVGPPTGETWQLVYDPDPAVKHKGPRTVHHSQLKLQEEVSRLSPKNVPRSPTRVEIWPRIVTFHLGAVKL